MTQNDQAVPPVDEPVAWPRDPAAELEPAAGGEHPLDSLLRWWGTLRFPDEDNPLVPPQDGR
jgi:hypothetical protein